MMGLLSVGLRMRIMKSRVRVLVVEESVCCQLRCPVPSREGELCVIVE